MTALHTLLTRPVLRALVFILGAAVLTPWLLDQAGAWLHPAAYARCRDLWQLAGTGLFIVLFCLACRAAYQVEDRDQ
jgi:hypothetical protein